jgi:subtilase family serine protease
VAGGAELTPATTVGDSGAYSPAYLQSAYNAPSATAGSGQTVAVVDPFDSTTLSSDLAGYRSHYGLPPCTTASGCFRKVDQGGGTSYPAADASWAQEISLDLDMVSALCPHCNILLVEANSTAVSDVGTAVNTAVALGANVVSNSYSAAEYPTEMSDSAAFYHHPGVAIVAASGDVGYGAAFPAISSDAVAVGGTTLNQSSNGGSRNATETAWSGGGSGCSSYVAKPSWQHDSSCAARIGVDVSAVADPNTGVWVYTGGQWAIYGGTSAAAPIVAAMYALAGNAVTAGAQPASYPYLHHGSLNDVVSGSNGSCSVAYFCTAGPGYDGPTGLGTPNTAAAFQSGVAPGVTVVAAAGSVTTQAVMSSLAANSCGGATAPFYNIPADFTLAGSRASRCRGRATAAARRTLYGAPTHSDRGRQHHRPRASRRSARWRGRSTSGRRTTPPARVPMPTPVIRPRRRGRAPTRDA